jgi:hypothetical protein
VRLDLIASCGAAAMVLAAAADAHAANGTKPRVAPVFVDGQCLVTVDRSVDPVLELPIAIPFEDDVLTADEPPDSRTFQFFAMCRDHPGSETLPSWVRTEDAELAMQLGLIDALPGPEDVLDAASAWSDPGCVHAITGADERIPINCASTTDGLAWDTRDVAPGTYVIRGYTYEPPTNLWTPRDGLVHVTDGDDADPEPAVALMSPYGAARVPADAGLELTGCAVGPGQLEVTIAWAAIGDLQQGGEVAWTEIETVLVEDGSFATIVYPPAQALYEALFFRAQVRTADGRVAHGYTHREAVFVLGCDAPQPTAYPDACGVASEPPPSNAGSCDPPDPAEPADDASSDGGADPSASGGAGCRAGAPLGGRRGAWGLGALLWVVSRRR